jgi:2-desacetyl-2-hydroxyethyl bacteriochlorophyllide A dehydrogenase
MQGVIFPERGQAILQEEPEPVCAPDTVLLQTLFSGLTNGTERNVLLGGNYGGGRFPNRCGYQCVSRVIECGAQITRFSEGDVVYTGTFPGHVALHTARESDLIIKLPAGLEPREAALLGVASVPMHDLRRAATAVEDNVLVMGAGLIGQFAAQEGRLLGTRVTMADRDERRLALAQSLGAEQTLNTSDEAGQARLEALAPFSVVVEATGADVLGTIIGDGWGKGLVGHRARVLIIAGRDQVSYNFNAAQGHEVAVLHAGHFEQSDLEQVVRHAAAGRLRIGPLIQDVVPIEEASRIYEILRDRPNELLGTVFVWP